MKKVVFFDDENNACFLISLQSFTKKGRTLEALNQLASLYPYTLEAKNLLLIKINGSFVKSSRQFICFVIKEPLTPGEYLIPELFLLNRAKRSKCAVCYTKNGLFRTIFCNKAGFLNILDQKTKPNEAEVFSKEEMLSQLKKSDIFRIHKKNYFVRKTLFALSLLFLIAAPLIMVFTNNVQKRKAESELKHKIELAAAQKISQEKAAHKHLEELQKSYIQLYQNVPQDMYHRLCIICKNIGANSTIENLSIEKNNFSVDIYTKNALNILKSFESDADSIQEVRMTRLNFQNNTEFTTFTGQFCKALPEEPKITNEDTQKLTDFYEQKIKELTKSIEQKKFISDSECTATIRKLLLKNRCQEQNLLCLQNGKKTELEYIFLSNYRFAASFLQDCSKEKNCPALERLRLKNNGGKNGIQITATFVKESAETSEKNKSLAFRSENHNFEELTKEVIQKTLQKTTSNQNNPAIAAQTTPKPPTSPEHEQKSALQNAAKSPAKELRFVGKNRVHESVVILAKNTESGKLFRIPLSAEETQEPFATETSPGIYMAKISNTTYIIK